MHGAHKQWRLKVSRQGLDAGERLQVVEEDWGMAQDESVRTGVEHWSVRSVDNPWRPVVTVNAQIVDPMEEA